MSESQDKTKIWSDWKISTIVRRNWTQGQPDAFQKVAILNVHLEARMHRTKLASLHRGFQSLCAAAENAMGHIPFILFSIRGTWIMASIEDLDIQMTIMTVTQRFKKILCINIKCFYKFCHISLIKRG